MYDFTFCFAIAPSVDGALIQLEKTIKETFVQGKYKVMNFNLASVHVQMANIVGPSNPVIHPMALALVEFEKGAKKEIEKTPLAGPKIIQ